MSIISPIHLPDDITSLLYVFSISTHVDGFDISLIWWMLEKFSYNGNRANIVLWINMKCIKSVMQ